MPGASGLHRGFTEVLALHCSFIKDLGLDSSTIRALELPTVASSGPWGWTLAAARAWVLTFRPLGLGVAATRLTHWNFAVDSSWL